jgi:hypothetical protein
VPKSSAAAELPRTLLGLWPNLFSSVLSFWIIGSYWLAHRRISEVVGAYDRRMQLINLLFLMWIVLGVIDALREAVLEAYDRYIGLELSEVAVDGCITKAPCGGVKAGRSPVDRGKQGIKRSTAVDGEGISP